MKVTSWSATASRPAPGSRVVYDVARRRGAFGAARVEGEAIVWEIDDRPEGDWLVRCDRVDFPPGGVAYRHTHPARGSACCSTARIRIDSAGESHEYGPGEWWYESGPEPVFAAASADEETAFVRVMLVPARAGGQAHDPLRRPGRRREAEAPARDGSSSSSR